MRLSNSTLVFGGAVVFTVTMVAIKHLIAPLIVSQWGIVGTIGAIGALFYAGVLLDRHH